MGANNELHKVERLAIVARKCSKSMRRTGRCWNVYGNLNR